MKVKYALTRSWKRGLAFLSGLLLIVGCSAGPSSSPTDVSASAAANAVEQPIVLGYSNWAGWWPWAIAESEGLFAKHGVNVQMKWFDSYVGSMEALAAGEIDGNSQTLNDTISFVGDAAKGEVVVLLNDYSAGNDKIIVSEEIQSLQDLRGKDVAIEAGVVDDFLLALALKDAGMQRSDVNILDMGTEAAAEAFAQGKADAVGAFPPFWARALERPGSKSLVSSLDYLGAIPDILAVTEELASRRPQQVQAIVETWFDVLQFMKQNPEKSDMIMAERAGVTTQALQPLKEGTWISTLEQNKDSFVMGEGIYSMPFAAKEMTAFMLDVGFIDQAPDLDSLFDASFVNAQT